MNRNMLIAVVLAALLLFSLVQAYQLIQLKARLAPAFIGLGLQQIKSKL